VFAFKLISMLGSVNYSTNGGKFIYRNSNSLRLWCKTTVYIELGLKPGFNSSV